MAENKGVLIFCETTKDKLAAIATELLGCGRKLADNLGQELSAVLVGSGVSALAKEAIACGADAIITSCPLCYGVFRRPSLQFKLPNIFITDLCRIALGEKPWPDGSR
jgi:hypothetical protein